MWSAIRWHRSLPSKSIPSNGIFNVQISSKDEAASFVATLLAMPYSQFTLPTKTVYANVAQYRRLEQLSGLKKKAFVQMFS